METKNILFKKEYGGLLEDFKIEDEKLTLVIGDDKKTVVFESEHSQDCCEHVYADFSILKYLEKDLENSYISEIVVKGVEGMGFVMHIGRTKFFVPCYNSQNGYYSSNLSLLITEGETKTKIDLEGFIDDDIN